MQGIDMDSMNDLTAHVTTATVAVYMIDWLKRSSWFRWMGADTPNLNKMVNVLVAIAMSLGLTWTGDMNQGWVLMIPPLSVLQISAWEALKQWCAQQLLFEAVKARKGPELQVPLPKAKEVADKIDPLE